MARVVGDGVVQVSQLAKKHPAIVERIGVARAEFQHAVDVFQRTVQVVGIRTRRAAAWSGPACFPDRVPGARSRSNRPLPYLRFDIANSLVPRRPARTWGQGESRHCSPPAPGLFFPRIPATFLADRSSLNSGLVQCVSWHRGSIRPNKNANRLDAPNPRTLEPRRTSLATFRRSTPHPTRTFPDIFHTPNVASFETTMTLDLESESDSETELESPLNIA